MERPGGAKASSGHHAARKKRSNYSRRPHCNPESHNAEQNALTFLADFAGRGILKSSRLNANMDQDLGRCRLPSPSHMRSDENCEDGMGEPFLESGCLGNENKLKNLKRKLDSITRPLHTKTALQIASGSRPVDRRSSDAVDGNGALQKQKSGTDRGGKRLCREELHKKSNCSGVPPMGPEHVCSSSALDSSLQLVSGNILPCSGVQNPPTTTSSPQAQPICCAPEPAILSMHPTSNHQPRDSSNDFSPRRSTTAACTKTVISPNGSGFHPNHTEVIHCITRIIQGSFNEPWSTWKKIPMTVRDQWFDEFQESYYWQPDHARQIRLNFEARGMARLKDVFCAARKNLTIRPFWLSSEVWDSLIQYWESPGFKSISVQAKINRASDRDGLGPSLHTCGSIPMSEHKRRLEEETGEEVTPIKLFVRTHQRKDKTWIDIRSSLAYEKFMAEWNKLQSRQNATKFNSQGEGQTSAQPAQPATPLSESEVWIKTNKTKKGTIYGLGSEAVKYKGLTPSSSKPRESTPLWYDSPEFQEFFSKKVVEISSEWNARLEQERRDTEELRRRVAELEKEKQVKKAKKKKKKRLKQMEQMMKLLQMSYASLSEAQASDDESSDDDNDDDDDSTDSE